MKKTLKLIPKFNKLFNIYNKNQKIYNIYYLLLKIKFQKF